MESFGSRSRGCVEENILAIIDGIDSKGTQDANDDRLIFLQAVRAASLDQGDGVPPTKKMCKAVFQILRAGKSLELIMESFRLLNEIDKRFRRVHLSNEGAESSHLMAVEEVWSPFDFNLDITSGEKDTAEKFSNGTIDSSVRKFSLANVFQLRSMIHIPWSKLWESTLAVVEFDSGTSPYGCVYWKSNLRSLSTIPAQLSYNL